MDPLRPFDSNMQLLGKVLDLRAEKSQVISSNIANAETPGFSSNLPSYAGNTLLPGSAVRGAPLGPISDRARYEAVQKKVAARGCSVQGGRRGSKTNKTRPPGSIPCNSMQSLAIPGNSKL